MLYANEEVELKVYDPETGAQTSPFPQEDDIDLKEYNEIIRQSKAVKQTINTEGWQILEELLKGEIEDIKAKLIYCEDSEKVVRFQEAAKVYQSVLNIAAAKSLEGDQLQQGLQDQDLDN